VSKAEIENVDHHVRVKQAWFRRRLYIAKGQLFPWDDNHWPFGSPVSRNFYQRDPFRQRSNTRNEECNASFENVIRAIEDEPARQEF
jgi:hypothetical protein